jgi:ATP-dependent DNA helicase RecG
MNENQNVEYKETWRDEYLKWICGFANAQGGKIYIGIDDKGNVVGLTEYKKLLEEIPNKIASHLGIVADVNLRSRNKNYFIEVIIKTSEVAISYHGNYYYRSGSTKQELKGAALQQFLLRKMGRSWDDMAAQGASFKDIDDKAIKNFIVKALDQKRISPSAARDGIRSLLSNLHLVNEKGKLKCAALLLFGKDPLKYFTHAYFKIGRFGDTDHDLKFQDVIEGNIFEMTDNVIDLLRSKYLSSPIRYEGLLRKEELEYPLPALKEAILNAIVHKNYAGPTIQLSVYDDRLILWNPGVLPPEITIEQLKKKHSSYPRNKNIADIFFKAGYIESWGRGISKMLDACKDAGLPEPEFVEHAGGIQIIFLKDIYQKSLLINYPLNERQIEALLLWKKEGVITTGKYRNKFKVTDRTALRDLIELVNYGLLKKSGDKKATRYIYMNYPPKSI